jgi:hypothetical protein
MVFFFGGCLMKRQLRVRVFAILVGVAFAALMSHASVARAQVQYRWDTGNVTESFNNSEGTETEDNWVANAFQVVDGGTHIVSIEFVFGGIDGYTNKPASAVIYQGFDLHDPSAGGGLVRLSTTDTTITANPGDLVTITLDTPVDLNVDDIFYAAVLIPQVQRPGANEFPWANDTMIPLGYSFFDVGPAQGAPYDLDNTANATVNGAFHPVVHFDVQHPGTTLLRANATAG